MALNKRGQRVILSIMLAIIAFIMALGFSKPIIESIEITSNSSSINCTSPTITGVTKATCIIIDVGLFYFLGSCIAAGIAYITGKKNITGVLTAIFVFIAVTVIITPLKDLIILFRDINHLNCASAAISVGANLTCLFVDLWLFYFVVTAIAAGITYIFMKKVLPE